MNGDHQENGIMKRILVADDEKLVQLFLKSLLTQWGFDVEFADSGFEVLDKLQDRAFELLIMDVEMPGMSGMETTLYLRERLKMRIPIILTSAYQSNESINEGYRIGMSDYLQKPIVASILLSKVEKCLLHNETQFVEKVKINCHNQRSDKLSDLTKLLQVLGNDKLYLKEMVDNFLELSPGYYDELLEAYEKSDFILVKQLSHKLKSSLELLSVRNIANNMKLINKYSGNVNEREKLAKLMNYFKESFPRLYNDLKQENQDLGN